MKTSWLQIIFLAIIAAVLVASHDILRNILSSFLNLVETVLPPFIIALVIAWLLDPLLDKLQARKVPRILAVTVVYVLFLGAAVAAIRFLVPSIIEQARQLATDLPDYYTSLSGTATDLMKRYEGFLTQYQLPTSVNEALSTYSTQIGDATTSGLKLLGNLILSAFSKVLWLVLIPIVAFYLSNDIDRIREKAALFIPKEHRAKTVEIFTRLENVFSSYIRGLTIVCLLYAITTAILLSILGLKYGIVLGVVAGLLYAVPYIGAIATVLLVLLVGIATYPGGISQAYIPAIAMIVLNQIYDMLISPRILGSAVGLHPVISIMALMAGGQIAGIIGMILAVPVAACIQEIILEFHPELRKQKEKSKKKKKKFDIRALFTRKPKKTANKPS